MGGGGEKKKTNAMLDQTFKTSNQDFTDVAGQANKQYGTATDRGTQVFKSLYGGAQDLWNDPNGGYDTTRIDDAIGRLRGTAGSVDTAAMRKAEPLFREFMDTGGYSDKDVSNIRSRGTAGIPAMYAQMRAEAARQGAVQGGAGPGRAALMARMGRDQARGIADASLNTELGIKENVNKGRQWGGTSMTGMEAGVADAIARQNAINAQIEGQAAGLTMDRQSQINANKFKSLDIMGQLYGQEGQNQATALQTRLGNRNALDVNSGLVGQRYANNKPWYETILPTVGGLAGAAGGVMTGLGGLGVGGKK